MNKQVKMKTEKAHTSLSGKKFKRIENQISMFAFGLSLLAKLIRAWFHLGVDEVLLVEKSQLEMEAGANMALWLRGRLAPCPSTHKIITGLKIAHFVLFKIPSSH